jgi:hypothetical protein
MHSIGIDRQRLRCQRMRSLARTSALSLGKSRHPRGCSRSESGDRTRGPIDRADEGPGGPGRLTPEPHCPVPSTASMPWNILELSYDQLATKLRELAYLNSGLEIAITALLSVRVARERGEQSHDAATGEDYRRPIRRVATTDIIGSPTAPRDRRSIQPSPNRLSGARFAVGTRREDRRLEVRATERPRRHTPPSPGT